MATLPVACEGIFETRLSECISSSRLPPSLEGRDVHREIGEMQAQVLAQKHCLTPTP